MALTNKQREELHKAIAEYLHNCNFKETLDSFLKEAQIQFDTNDKQNSALSNILEKKWVSVVRLQKKNLELEQKIEQLTEQLNSGGVVVANKKNLTPEEIEQLFPKTPAKHTLQSHRAGITRIAFHPQYSMLASCGDDAAIKIWDFDTGQLERTLKGHTAAINDVNFDNQGKYLASCSSDLTIKLWDLNQFVCVKTLNGHDHSVSTVQFLPSGDYLVSASRDKTIKLWEVATGYCVRTYSGHTDWVRCAVPDETGKMIASCSTDQSIIIWNVDNTNPIHTLDGHEHVIEYVIWVNREESKRAIVSSDYYKATKSEKPEENKSTDANGTLSKSTNYPNFVISASRDKTIKIWNATTGECINTLLGHDNWVRGLAFHHSGKYIYSCSDDKSIRIWDLRTGKNTKKILDAHSHFVSTIASNPRYLVIATGSVDTSVKVWECK